MKLSFTPWTVFWALLIAMILGGLVFLTRKGAHPDMGFKDVVKNPELLDDFAQWQQQMEVATSEAKTWDDDQVASAVKKFVLETASSQDEPELSRILEDLGNRTHPIVLRLLRDPSLSSRLVTPTGTNVLPEAPFNRACDLLGDRPGAEVVEVLSAFQGDPSDAIREDAALAIARTGAVNSIPFVRKAFSDEVENVGAKALMGLKKANDRSVVSDQVREALFPDLLELVRANRNPSDAADLLYRFNPSRAMEFFLSDEVFSAESPVLDEVLEVMADANASAPHERLKSLIATLEMRDLKRPITKSLGEALRLLGQHRREDDRDFLRSRTSHPNKNVAKGAVAGLLCSFGLEGFEQRMWEARNESGSHALSASQRRYLAVLNCDSEINNGGLTQYFFNSSGNDWRDALEGFRAMGLTERFSILNDAVAKFGESGPAVERRLRQDQLSTLAKRDEDVFDALDARYYNSSEAVEVSLLRFVLENPQDF